MGAESLWTQPAANQISPLLKAAFFLRLPAWKNGSRSRKESVAPVRVQGLVELNWAIAHSNDNFLHVGLYHHLGLYHKEVTAVMYYIL